MRKKSNISEHFWQSLKLGTNPDFGKCEHTSVNENQPVLDRESTRLLLLLILRIFENDIDFTKNLEKLLIFSFFLYIAVQPPRQQVTHLNKKPVLQQGPPTEDEIRKWTEKKRRSKSLPRGGSEIDEILGK